jgi:hypothetical protein
MSLGLLSLCLSVCLHGGVSPEVRAAAVLSAWDDRRAEAWAAGDAGALADLYTVRSSTGRADGAMLRTWTRRGLRVEGMRMQLLDLDVRHWSHGRLSLVVTDRLAGGVAVGVGGGRVPLPRDEPSTRSVVLRRVAGEWRVRSVS